MIRYLTSFICFLICFSTFGQNIIDNDYFEDGLSDWSSYFASGYNGTLIQRVHPCLINKESRLSNVNGVLNAIRVCDDMMDENILIGHGAGALPTGSAVVGDIVEIARNIISNASGRLPASSFQSSEIKPIPLKDMSTVESEYFLRLNVLDKPGVLSKISGIVKGAKINQAKSHL